MATIFKYKRKKREYPKKTNDDGKYYKMYQSGRDIYMQAHPLCEECLKENKITPSVECHHIVPFMSVQEEEERIKLLMDETNWIALCKQHHDEKHKKKEKWWL